MQDVTSSSLTLPTYIDSTMMNAFKSCPQKFYREFVQGYRPPGISIDLHAGACFAGALEETYDQIWLKHQDLATALIIAEARFFQEWGDVEPPDWKRTAKTKDRVWEAVESYFAHYPPLTDHVKPYMTSHGAPTLEYTFAVPLEPAIDADYDRGITFPVHPETKEPFLYVGRFDMLGSYQGRPCVRDEKTTGSSIGRNWASQWDLRSQFLGYVWACRQGGIDVDTVVVRGIAIQKEQIVHAEAVKPYSNHLVTKWHEQLRRNMWRLVKCYQEGYWDYDLGEACTRYGNCPFMTVCASNNPEPWLQEFITSRWNPLNKNPSGVSIDEKRSF